jgi:hypothetical protein
MRLPFAMVLALPAIVLCAWYTLIALMAHLSHQAELKVREPLTLSLFHLHLHDRLMRDWRRFIMPEPQRDSALPTYGLALASGELDKLDKRLPPDDGVAYYVDGLLIANDRAHEVQARYRGGRYWHPKHPQKSWKIRVKGENSVNGFQTFSLINTAEPVPFEEDVILEIAREQGLLSPEYFPFRLLLNKSYMGVYFFEAQPDGDLLRRQRRAPGSVYSGSDAPIDQRTGVSTLFESADHFTQVSQGLHQQLGERRDLEAFIVAIKQGTASEFVQYADKHLALDKFALFDALDVVFGCNQHDYADNHKLYYDPYSSRFEPIAWNFRGCKHELEFNRTENPWLLRLKQVPGYLARRNRLVYQLLKGAASSESLHKRTHDLLDRLQPDQARDPYWDAHQLLPGMSPYYAQLRRPLNRALQDIAVETRLHELHKRGQFLSQTLEREAIVAHVGKRAPEVRQERAASETHATALDVVAGGESGYRITRLQPSWSPGCTPGTWQIYADTELDDRFEPELDRLLATQRESVPAQLTVEVYPGVRFESRPTHPARGSIRAVPQERRYRFYIRAQACEAIGAALQVENLATARRSAITTVDGRQTVEATSNSPCEQTYRPEAGYSSPHPWCIRQHSKDVVYLGPGVVEVARTRVFESNQVVVIHAGTTLRMSENASLIAYGRLEARGTLESPIRVEPSAKSWGGIALQGPATAGSYLNHVTIVQGSHPASATVVWPGTLNVHDSTNVGLVDCRLQSNVGVNVAVHVADTQRFEMRNCTIRDTTGNALEVKYSTATLEALAVVNVGGDALVVTGADTRLVNSRLVAARGAAISIGQMASLGAKDSLIARAARGIHVREGSILEQDAVLLYDDEVGVRLEPNDDGFPNKARINGDVFYAARCKTPVQTVGKRRKSQERVVTDPAQAALEVLRAQVLHLPSWNALDKSIAGLISGAVP